MHLWTYIKSLNRTSLVVIYTVIMVVIFTTMWQIFTPKKISYTEKENTIPEKIIEPSPKLNEEVTYYGVPLVIHPSQRYYKFNRYDLDNNKTIDLVLPDSSFWAEIDYADISWEENGKRVFSNEWIAIIHDNPKAVFKITGTISKDDCYERVDNPILSQEFCANNAPEYALIIDNMEIFDTSTK